MRARLILMTLAACTTSARADMSDDEIRKIGTLTYIYDKCSENPQVSTKLSLLRPLTEQAMAQNHIVFSGGVRKAAKSFASYRYDLTAYCWEFAATELKLEK